MRVSVQDILVEFDAFAAQLREKIASKSAAVIEFESDLDGENRIMRIRMMDGDGTNSDLQWVLGVEKDPPEGQERVPVQVPVKPVSHGYAQGVARLTALREL